jgi:HK97 family phage major capsid protein
LDKEKTVDNIKELQNKLQVAFDEMKNLNAGIEKAESEEDKATARTAFSAKRDEVQQIKEKLDEAVANAEQEKALSASLAAANAMTTVTPPAGVALTSVGAVDHGKELREKEGLALKYLQVGPKLMSGEEMKAMSPGNGTSFSEKTEGGIVLPRSFALNLFGMKWARQMGWTKQDIAEIAKASTMVSGTDALGGYTIPEDFRLPMLDLPVEEAHIMQRATVVPAPTGEITMPKSKQTDADEYGGMVGEWIAEAGLKPKTDTRFEQVKISTHEYAMHTQISIRLLNRSAIAMENWLQTRGRQVCLDAMDQAFINGDGSGKPLGILQTDGIRERKRETTGTVTRSDTTKLKFKLKPYHRAGGVYVIDDTVYEALEDLTDNEGRQLFSASMANGPYDRICGYPYIVTTRTPDLGSDGDMMFVDLREYYIPMEQDIMIKRSDDYDIVHNVATIVMFVVVGGKLVQPRCCAILGDEETS